MNTTFSPFLLPCAAIVLLGQASVTTASAQALKVTSLTQAGNQLNITVQNTGPSTSFRLDGSPTMAAGTWVTENGVAFTAVTGQPGFHRATFTQTVPGKRFFRVVGLASATSADDPDGDGLTTTYETTLGTNPNVSDTDGDGFSDGQEIAYGTDPKVNTSKPTLETKAAVEFVDLTAPGTEGSPHMVQITLDKPYTGPVKYAVVPANSTATAPGDYAAVGGTVDVAGTTAAIPITWTDDLIIKTDRLLALDIVALPTDGYRSGGRSRHIIRLAENDAWWIGVCTDTYAQRNFRLKMTRHAAGLQVTFASGAGNDGLPTLAGETPGSQSSQTEGLVPVGVFPGTVQFDTPTRFKITSPAMPVAGSGITGPITDIIRTVTLESMPEGLSSVHSIQPLRVIGQYTETLTSLSAPYLNRTFTGIFVLARELPTPLSTTAP